MRKFLKWFIATFIGLTLWMLLAAVSILSDEKCHRADPQNHSRGLADQSCFQSGARLADETREIQQ